MSFDFDNCYWHDSILKDIFIDRSDRGNQDTIEMTIDWYDEPASKIVFKGVHLFKAALNFGVVGKECILQAEIASQEDPDLLSYYQKVKAIPGSKKINCYLIETNATGGIIKILAESVEKIPL